MVLITCQAVSKSFGSRQLFRQISLSIEKGDRIGMIGPNGAGKSTFLKILAGEEIPDEGEVIRRRELRVGYVPQLSQYDEAPVLQQVCRQAPDLPDVEVQATIILGKVGFERFDQAAATLSGGWRKRLDLACELIKDPDILLLDEPTNHLDTDGIDWLQSFLQRECRTYAVISHDRYFLEQVTSEVVELNPRYPEGIFAVQGSYSKFLEKRDEFFSGQAERERSLSSKMRRELEWLRQSPKARTTKSRSRIQEAHRLMGELSDVQSRNKVKKSHIDFVGSERQTRRLCQGRNLAKTLGDRGLFSKLDVDLSPGYRLGIVGPNGTGKTTLLRLLAGTLEPDVGTLKWAEDIQVVYFDQHREQLPLDTTLREALCLVGDEVTYRGRKIHVNGWAQRFLFPSDYLDLPIGHLSGGERARILIARLMLRPADILLLDEPTNDLDIQTLEILEESLRDFPGAVVLITHDRFLLDQVATEVLGFGYEETPHYCADHYQWEAHVKKLKKEAAAEKARAEAPVKLVTAPKPRRLTYKEKMELERMEQTIHEAEEALKVCEERAASPEVATDAGELQKACEALQKAQTHVEGLYARWEELDQLA